MIAADSVCTIPRVRKRERGLVKHDNFHGLIDHLLDSKIKEKGNSDQRFEY